MTRSSLAGIARSTDSSYASQCNTAASASTTYQSSAARFAYDGYGWLGGSLVALGLALHRRATMKTAPSFPRPRRCQLAMEALQLSGSAHGSTVGRRSSPSLLCTATRDEKTGLSLLCCTISPGLVISITMTPVRSPTNFWHCGDCYKLCPPHCCLTFQMQSDGMPPHQKSTQQAPLTACSFPPPLTLTSSPSSGRPGRQGRRRFGPRLLDRVVRRCDPEDLGLCMQHFPSSAVHHSENNPGRPAKSNEIHDHPDHLGYLAGKELLHIQRKTRFGRRGDRKSWHEF